jgi:hypothetical protein
MLNQPQRSGLSIIRLVFLGFTIMFLNSACTSQYPKLADVSEQEFPVVFSIAEQLGYTADDLLVQANKCTVSNFSFPLTPITTSCGIFVAFETTLPLNEFSSLVAQLEFEKTGTNNRYGNDLFNYLNLSNHITEYRRLTVDGNDGWGEGKRELLPDILVQSWNYKYRGTQFLNVDFYGTAELNPHVDLGDESIEGNIIVVYLHLGTVQTWPE